MVIPGSTLTCQRRTAYEEIEQLTFEMLKHEAPAIPAGAFSFTPRDLPFYRVSVYDPQNNPAEQPRMNGTTRDNLQAVGVLFRFVTPLMIVAIGWLASGKFDSIDSKQDAQDEHRLRLEIKFDDKLDTLTDAAVEQKTLMRNVARDVLRNETRLDAHETRIRTIEINGVGGE